MIRTAFLCLWFLLTATAAFALQSRPTSFESVTWSPNSRRIAYVEKTNAPRPRIVIANADGTKPTRFEGGPLSDGTASTHQPMFDGSSIYGSLKWSPNGRSLAFIEKQPLFAASYEAIDRIGLLTANGGHFRSVVMRGVELGALAWSPDGKHLIAAGNRNVFLKTVGKERRADLWLIDTSTGSKRKLAACPGDVTSLEWSPTGEYLLFTARPLWDRTRAQVIRMTADGRKNLVISRSPADSFFAAWSPDGSQFVFTDRNANDATSLRVVGTSGRADHELRSWPRLELQGLSWPARDRILALTCAPPSDIGKVTAIDPKTERSRELAHAKGFFAVGDWSPDGRFLAYLARGTPNSDPVNHIYRLDLIKGELLDLARAKTKGRPER